MELRAGAGAGSLGGPTVGGRSSGTVVGGRSPAVGHPVGGVEGWHRSIIVVDVAWVDCSVDVTGEGSEVAMGGGPGVPRYLANHGSVARR